jgi:hypothetical protein
MELSRRYRLEMPHGKRCSHGLDSGRVIGGAQRLVQPSAAADALQRPLRSRFQARLRRSVRHEFHRSGKEGGPGGSNSGHEQKSICISSTCSPGGPTP